MNLYVINNKIRILNEVLKNGKYFILLTFLLFYIFLIRLNKDIYFNDDLKRVFSNHCRILKINFKCAFICRNDK